VTKHLSLALLTLLAVLFGLSAHAATRTPEKPLPIIFVHGNGDSAGSWITTIWRFESNGYPGELLDAIDLRNPVATTRFDQSEPARSTPDEEMKQLAAEVAAVKKRTHAAKVILVGQSRGGNIVRDYIKNGGGADSTAIAVLCGAVNHGVIVSNEFLVGSEFNGASAFMRDLNGTTEEGDIAEIVPGVRFLTIRSDSNDKYAQPDGRFIGHPGVATGLGYDAPELRGAVNVAIPKIDHRETGYGPAAFGAMYKFITGHPPRTLAVRPESEPRLSGKITGFDEDTQTNIGVAGATLEIYRIAPDTGERLGFAVWRNVTGPDGAWGPVRVLSNAYYEFVLAVPGAPVTHIYRSPFPRGSRYVDLRPQLLAKDDRDVGAVVYMVRPRGYFGIGRDRIALGGRVPPRIAAGVPSVPLGRLAFPADPPRTVFAEFNGERIPTRTWPLRDNQLSVAEFTW
jgi:pimeloyl-ACP methyl ester carboxylesterase